MPYWTPFESVYILLADPGHWGGAMDEVVKDAVADVMLRLWVKVDEALALNALVVGGVLYTTLTFAGLAAAVPPAAGSVPVTALSNSHTPPA